jgi:hypothetical protein
MGVRIHRPPPRYIHYIRQKLKPPKEDTLPQEHPGVAAAEAASNVGTTSGAKH